MDNVNILCTPVNNVEYQWSAPFSLTSPDSSFTKGKLNSNNDIELQISIKGCTESTSKSVFANDINTTINLFDPLCGQNDGKATALPTGGAGEYSYQWNDTLAQTSQTATNLYAGIYDVIVTDQNGCKDTGTAFLDNIDGPGVNIEADGDPTSCNASATALVVNGSKPYSYQWNDSLQQITQTADSLCKGNYLVKVIDDNGCVGIDTIKLDDPLSIRENTKNINAKIYPNPARDNLTIELEKHPDRDLNLKVLDQRGNLIQEQKFGNSKKKQLNMSKLSQGVYYLKLSSEKEGVLIEKVVVY
ncbi:MAG: T9SS type A sorting domain-containing protein [Flavobacteriales bacterium]